MRISLLAGTVAVYLVALIIMLPAAMIDSALTAASDGRLRLAAMHGTLWSGNGQLQMLDAAQHVNAVKDITWHFSPRALLRARLGLDVESGAAEHFAAAANFSDVELSGVDVVLPASALAVISPRLAALMLNGELTLRAEQFTLRRSGARGDAVVQWQNAGSALTSVSPLGAYELQLHAADAVMQLSLHTLTGPLRLDGSGSWNAGERLAFTALARIARPGRDKLVPLLRLIARQTGEDSFEMKLN